ncbi:ATPase [Paraburkholderia lacunae]|uniref:histidine kinase n=2 Tax=Paraburkholderia lacunae TaxID=2211104 RepID=A0A370MVA3_9BURK|nr:ATPase [Paraburkholderia lacunae]
MLATQRTQLAVAESAMRTWSQTLHDFLDVAPVPSGGIVLDESVTNLRDLIDGVVALLSMNAARRGTRLVATVDPTVATRILADSARLGQMIFHLLSRAIQLGAHQEIAVVVRSEPLNPGSQRIFVSLTGTDAGDPPAAQLQFFEPGADEPSSGAWPVGTDVGMALCETIAQRMRGELSLSSGSDCGIYARFSAPFAVEQWGPSSEPARHAPAPSAIAAQVQDASLGFQSEPFERRYLDALAEEGIDLRTFMVGWRHSIDDDLARLSGLNRQRDSEGLRTVLHRLSGAVGLVGAHSLMEALRRASVASLEFDAGAIDALVERAKTLATQLDTAFDPHRSLIQ